MGRKFTPLEEFLCESFFAFVAAKQTYHLPEDQVDDYMAGSVTRESLFRQFFRYDREGREVKMIELARQYPRLHKEYYDRLKAKNHCLSDLENEMRIYMQNRAKRLRKPKTAKFESTKHHFLFKNMSAR